MSIVDAGADSKTTQRPARSSLFHCYCACQDGIDPPVALCGHVKRNPSTRILTIRPDDSCVVCADLAVAESRWCGH